MCEYKYDQVNIDSADDSKRADVRSWTTLWRQLFVCSGVYSIYFALGLCFGAPTVLIPQIRNDENSTITISDDMASWLASVHGYSAVPWVFIIPVVARRIGRKISFIIVCVSTLVGYIVFYCSTSALQILISEIIQGVLLASNITLLVIIIAEYTSPRYRGVLLTFKSSVFFWGMWVANLMGTFLHWRNIAIIALLCSVYPLMAVLWPESPSWLAMKGRFEECAAAHHWLKGYHKDSENELVNLIHSQRKYIKKCAEQKESSSSNWIGDVVETVTCKAFYKPLLICIAFMSLYHFSGKFVCAMYAVSLIKQITGNDTAAYTGMLIMDGITIMGMEIGCVLSKFLNRRTLTFWSAFLGIACLFIISLYLCLISKQVIDENKIVSISLLTIFSVVISCGPMILPGCIFGELIFLRYKSSSLLIITLYSEVLMATVLKVSPYLFGTLSLHGTFFFYAVSASVITILLYKYLPETKDKSLQEIEAFFTEPTEIENVSNN